MECEEWSVRREECEEWSVRSVRSVRSGGEECEEWSVRRGV